MGTKSTTQMPIVLSADILASFRPSKTFKNNKPLSTFTSIDWDDSGEWAIASCTDESLYLYDTATGKYNKTVPSQKYGCDLARFTHSKDNILYASTKENDSLRYLSLEDNSFIRYYKGHTQRVTSLNVSPINDMFISTAMDHELRIWDVRSANCQGLLNLPAPLLASIDPTGLIFGVVSHPLGAISLYDLRDFDKQPFISTFINDDTYLEKFSYPPKMREFTKFEFSSDGKLILLGTRGHSHYIIDAFNLKIKYRLIGHSQIHYDTPTSGNICFSPDGKFVVCSSSDSHLIIWDIGSDEVLNKSKGDLIISIKPDRYITVPDSQIKLGQSLVQFNPKFALLATGDNELVSFILFLLLSKNLTNCNLLRHFGFLTN